MRTPSTTSTGRAYGALAGLLATVAALAVGELVAGLVPRLYSPVQAVGDTVIEFTPQPVKQFAIDTFGTGDKAALIIGTLAITLAFGTALGVVGRRRLPVAWAGIALFGLVGVGCSAFQEDLLSGVPSLVTVAVGIPLLTQLLRLAPSAAPRGEAAAAPAGAEGAAPVADVPTAGDRRRFLAVSGGVAVAAAAAVATGRSLIARRTAAVGAVREEIAAQIGQTAAPGASEGAAARPLGVVADPLPPLPEGVDFRIDGLAPFQTPVEDFYRIDIALAVPQIDPTTWSLRIHGMVDREVEHTYEDLLRREDLVEADITMTCVSNEVGGYLMSSGRWTGVPLVNLLEEAGVQQGADQLVGRDGDGFTTGFPVEVLDDGRPAILALLLDGEPLTPERGFPARVVVPGLYGYVSATKWITELELTTFDAFQQYWVERGWDEEAPIKLQSRIDVPKPLERVPAGEVVIAGVAWHQTVGIERVEISIDDGEWLETELAEELNLETWRQWRYVWQDAAPGNHRVVVRATNKAGEVQTDERQPPFPNGATGLMTLLVTVTEA
jgi:DMSO/TMAO reductase YedYZ molybdopterin-dependent catalytic subunit